MDSEGPRPKKVKRKAAFSHVEKAIILEEMEAHYDFLSSKFKNGSGTAKKKTELWETITEK